MKPFALILVCFVLKVSHAEQSVTILAKLEQDILVLVNQHRQSKNLNPLIWEDAIALQSRQHSKNMATGKADFGHKDFSKRADRIEKNFGGHSFAENVAFGQTTAKEVMDSWLNSPGHKKNIEGNYTHIGVGIATSKDGTLYFTQIFVGKSSN